MLDFVDEINGLGDQRDAHHFFEFKSDTCV